MYIYFDKNGTIKEIVNDKSIRNGSNEANKIYCYLEGEPEIDDIWYLQKLPSGELSNEVSFKNSTITKAIPYDAKRDMKYFKDFVQYKFYVHTLNTFLTSQNGLNLATIRIVVDNEIFALGELTFNVQENVINVDNGITQSQYDYLLLAYASRTLNEVVGDELDNLLDDKINAKLGDLADGNPKVFETKNEIENEHADYGIAVATDTGYIYVWNDTQQEYQSTGMKYIADVSLFYTKTESDSRFNNKANITSYLVVNWIDGAFIQRSDADATYSLGTSSNWMYAIIDLPKAIRGKSITSLFSCMPLIKGTAPASATTYFEDSNGNILLRIGNYGTSEEEYTIPLDATKLYISNRKQSSGNLTGVVSPYVLLNTYIGVSNDLIRELKDYNLSIGAIDDSTGNSGKNISSTTRARTDYIIVDSEYDNILIDAGNLRLRNIFEYDTTETTLLSATQNGDGSLTRVNYDIIIWDRKYISKYLLNPKPNKYYRLVFACQNDTDTMTQTDMNTVHIYGYRKGDVLNKMLVGEDVEVNTTFTRGTIQDGASMGNEVASTTRARTSFIESANENVIEIDANTDYVIHNILCFDKSNIYTAPMNGEKISVPDNAKILKFSTTYPYYRVVFRKVDNSDIVATDVEDAVTIYKRNLIETKEFRVFRVASSTATAEEKMSADYVCDGVNDEVEIQYAINQASTVGGTVKLSSGVFNIDAFQNSDTGGYSALVVPANFSYVRIEGIGIPQYWYNTTGTKLLVTSKAYNSVSNGASEYQYTVIRGDYVSETIGSHLNLELKDFAIQLYNNQKPITCVDTFYSNRIRMKRVNLWAFTDTTISIANPPSKAVQYCNGVRTVGGSNQSSITDYENVRVEGFYEGFKIGGEHIVMINAVAQYCVYGYTFGNFTWTNGYEHPDTLINCCDERNVNLPLFAGNVNGVAIDFINFNIERVASATPGGVLGDYAKETHKGAFRGRLEYTMLTSFGGGSSVDTPFWSNDGSGIGFETVNQAHLQQGTTTLRLTYAPNYSQKYYDIDLKALLIYDGTNWNYSFNNIPLANIVANPTLEGTEADLTGLEVDGTKYKVGGGSEVHLYGHYISAAAGSDSNINLTIYSNSNIPFETDTLKKWIKDNGFSVASNKPYVASGYYLNGRIVIGVGVSSSTLEVLYMYVNDTNTLTKSTSNYYGFDSITDTITQIF